MRNRFDEQLESLNNSLIRMGALCESAIANATKALLEGDRTLAGRAIEADSEIDQAEREVESLCLKLLYTRCNELLLPAVTGQPNP